MFSEATRTWSQALGIPADAEPSDVCAAFERLAPQLAPRDVGGIPVYCLQTSALPTSCRRGYCGGWTSSIAYWQLQPYLADDRGPGCVLVVADDDGQERNEVLVDEIQKVLLCAGVSDTRAEIRELAHEAGILRGSVGSIASILAHEFAHALEYLASGAFEEWTEMLSGSSTRFHRTVQHRFEAECMSTQLQTEAPEPQTDLHGPSFTRCVAHLERRLWRRGVRGEPHNVAGPYFGQPEYAECRRALASETSACQRLSFRQILSRPMPTAFQQLLEATR